MSYSDGYAAGLRDGVVFFETEWLGPDGNGSFGNLSLDHIRESVAPARAYLNRAVTNASSFDAYVFGFVDAASL